MTALSTSSSVRSNDPYIPQTDEAELQRLLEMSKVNGLGETIDFEQDQEAVQLLEDFGLGFNLDREVGEK